MQMERALESLRPAPQILDLLYACSLAGLAPCLPVPTEKTGPQPRAEGKRTRDVSVHRQTLLGAPGTHSPSLPFTAVEAQWGGVASSPA